MDIADKNPDESGNADGDNEDEQSIDELREDLAKEREKNENLNKALKESREKSKEIKEGKKDVQKDNGNDEQVIERVLRNRDLANKYNGENGLPKFDKKELLEYAREEGFGENVDLEKVYKLKYEADISDHKAKNVLMKNKGVITADGTAISTETAKEQLANAKSQKDIDAIMGLKE